jgi:hypothetical protein
LGFIVDFQNAPRWLLKNRNRKIDIQHYGPIRLAEFPNISPFDCLNGLNFFQFIFDTSVDLADKVQHRSVTTIRVEFEILLSG